MGHMTKSTVL